MTRPFPFKWGEWALFAFLGAGALLSPYFGPYLWPDSPYHKGVWLTYAKVTWCFFGALVVLKCILEYDNRRDAKVNATSDDLMARIKRLQAQGLSAEKELREFERINALVT